MRIAPAVTMLMGLLLVGGASVAIAQPAGSVTIIKDTEPDDSTLFDFTGSFGAFSLSDGQSATFTGLADGSYTVTETVPVGYELGLLFCSDPSGGTGVSPSTATAVIDLSEGEAITCTFNNIRQATVTIVKDALPDASQAFEFSGDLGDFSLVDDGSLSSTIVIPNLSPTTYSVYEDPVTGWTLTSITCEDPTADSQVFLSNREVYLDLSAGENVTCTFTNTRQQEPAAAIPAMSGVGVLALGALLAAAALWILRGLRQS